jgi:hypothetical protein
MLNCKQKIKHLKQFPSHKQFLLTSTQYASELKICELAYGYNKLIKKTDGEEFMISPFAPVNLPQLNKEEISTTEHGDNGFGHDEISSKTGDFDRNPTKGYKYQKMD